ncbi:MAG: hypothetical protein ACPGOY_11420 [Rhodospirillaceae bacterium]
MAPHGFRIGLALLALCAVLAAPLQAQQSGTAFVQGFEDLPLMDGLAQNPNDTLIFETAHGRLVEAVAAGALRAAAVQRFYADTLPQMGWTTLGPDLFQRDQERLRLDYGGSYPNLTVRFSLEPAG